MADQRREVKDLRNLQKLDLYFSRDPDQRGALTGKRVSQMLRLTTLLPSDGHRPNRATLVAISDIERLSILGEKGCVPNERFSSCECPIRN
jgi:hypothetical protein